MRHALINSLPSLDEQYLDFTARTSSIFAKYPQLEPIRYFIFKELLVQQHSSGWKVTIKHWLRPLLHRSRTRGDLGRADVLLWVEGRRDVIADALLPVYRELVSQAVKTQLVSFRGPDALPPSAVRVDFPSRAVPPAWAKEAWEALCYVVDPLCHRSLRRSFYHASAFVQGLLDELDRVLEIVKPKVVLCASTQLIGGAGLLATSRSRRALMLLLQHGILQPLYVPILADYILTWGQSSNETLLRLGVPYQKLVVVGSPRHDSMTPSANGDARTELLRSLSLPEKPTFVFFSNGNDLARNGPGPRECAMWLEKIAAKQSAQMNIVVRLHPNENGSLYENCPHLYITKETPDLATTLDGCDWVGSLCSTVLYDALLYNKPVWQFYADGWPELADNWKTGLAIRVSSENELDDRVKRILQGTRDKSPANHLSTRVFANHGCATHAIADFVQCHLEKDDEGSLNLNGGSIKEKTSI